MKGEVGEFKDAEVVGEAGMEDVEDPPWLGAGSPGHPPPHVTTTFQLPCDCSHQPPGEVPVPKRIPVQKGICRWLVTNILGKNVWSSYSFRTMYRLAHTLILLHILSNDRWVKRDDLCFSKVIKQLMDHRCITPLVSHVPAAHDVMDSP